MCAGSSRSELRRAGPIMVLTPTTLRKLIRVGERSVGVTVPKEWLGLLNLDVGSSVELALGAGYILLRPLSTARPKIVHSVRLKHDDAYVLSRLIIASYIEGYDIMSVEGRREVARSAFYGVASRLPGAIAMEGATFKVRVSVDEFNTDLGEVVGAMKATLSMMFELVREFFETGERKKLEDLLALDDDLDRLHFLGMRTIKRTAFREPSRAVDLSIAIKSLEHIGDALDRASSTILKVGLDPTRMPEACRELFKQLFSKVSSYVMDSIEGFVHADINKAMRVLREREGLAREILASAESCITIQGTLAVAHEAVGAVFEAAEIAEVATLRILTKMGLPGRETSESPPQ